MDSAEFFDALSAKIKHDVALSDEYLRRVRQAMDFAKDTEGEGWNGMFLMGLTLAGLELLPSSTSIERRVYWVQAPKPHPDAPNDWDSSYIIEVGALR